MSFRNEWSRQRKMTAYYNEIDPYAAQWLRNLIQAGHIAQGDVDERSIIDVRADDLRGYTQCHFFAGIGGWSLALRLAGWDDDRFVWTGSCPCQPFSAAGAGKAADDERHLWPDWFRLIRDARPSIVFGEQVEAAVGWGWIDLVHADLAAEGYAARFAVLPACGVGAPHIRQRLWFVAESKSGEQRGRARPGNSHGVVEATRARDGTAGRLRGAGIVADSGGQRDRYESGRLGRTEQTAKGGQPEFRLKTEETFNGRSNGTLADSDGRHASAEGLQRGGQQRQQRESGRTVRVADGDGAGLEVERIEPTRDQRAPAERGGTAGELADADSQRAAGSQPRQENARPEANGPFGDSEICVLGDANGARKGAQRGVPSGPGVECARGAWNDLDWLPCTDGKARPVEPGTFPLAHGIPGRVGRLRAYGNAIVPQVAAEFISAVTSGQGEGS